LTHRIATSIDELRYDFTIDQVYLFLEKCMRKELDDRKFQAISMAQSISYASSPPMGADRPYFRSKQRSWDKFMKTLDWDAKVEAKDIRTVRNVLSGAGIPIKVRKKGDT